MMEAIEVDGLWVVYGINSEIIGGGKLSLVIALVLKHCMSKTQR